MRRLWRISGQNLKGLKMTIYSVFSKNNVLISAHKSAADAIKAALIYQHVTGRPAYVESELA